jgi:predicted nucleotidyltransferase
LNTVRKVIHVGTPDKPEQVYGEFIEDCKSIFGSSLVSVCVYGSAARGEYVRGKSDINFLVVLESAHIEILRNTLGYMKKWSKRGIVTPLFLSREYISSSLDTFPIEYLEMKTSYQCLYGEDILEGLSLDRSFIRLQCEREIRSKLLRLRQAFLETQGNTTRVRELITQSMPTFVVLLKTLLYLKEEMVPARTPDVFSRSASVLGLEEGILSELLALKAGKSTKSKDDVLSFLGAYAAEMQKLVRIADEIPA